MSSTSRILYALVLALGIGSAASLPAHAQTANNLAVAIMLDDPVVTNIPQQDVQIVQPAMQALLVAMQKDVADRENGNSGALAADDLSVTQARQALIDVQLAADQASMPQLGVNLQGVLQMRDQLLLAEGTVGTAQQQLIVDQQARNSQAFAADLAAVHAAQLQSMQARQQWIAFRVQVAEANASGTPNAALTLRIQHYLAMRAQLRR